MPLAFYICAGIIALVLIFELAVIVYHLGVIEDYTINIHADLMQFRAKIELRELEKGAEPSKQREYWRDQNGFRHWRKANNA